MIRLIIGSVLLGLGLFMFLSAVLGLFRFRFVLNRMHAAAMGDTLGIFFVLAGLAVFRWDVLVGLKLLLVIGFMFLSGPTLSHLIAETAVFYHGDSKNEYVEEDRT